MKNTKDTEVSIRAGVPAPLDSHSSLALAGWVLVESRLGRQVPFSTAHLIARKRDGSANGIEIELPVTTAGKLCQVIQFPENIGELSWQPPGTGEDGSALLAIRRIGWLERVVRMNMGVFWIAAALPWRERRIARLTFLRSWSDPVGAYTDATTFTMRYAEARYPDWIKRFDALSEHDYMRIKAHIAQFPARPRFRVLVIGGGQARRGALDATLTSVGAQLYDECDLVVLDSESPWDDAKRGDFNASLARAGAQEWLMIVRAGDVLARHALYWFACEAQRWPRAVAVYSDDDRIDGHGHRFAPRFKPDWSPVHFLSTDYLGAAAVVQCRAAARAGGLTQDCCSHGNYDLLLRAIDATGESVRHIPALLLHRGGTDDEVPEAALWRVRSLETHYKRGKVVATVTGTPHGLRTRYGLPDAPPFVSIIVPTRDSLELLQRCVESILRKTEYPRYEVLVVDNKTTDVAALDYLTELGRRPRVRVLRYRRAFNYSAINNYAAPEAAGAVLCLLNNDTEVISSDWLEEMVGHLVQPGVGAVGAKLRYPNGKVQHAGVVVGPGGCHHLHVGLENDEPGYCDRAVVAHECSAVTAACLVTWKHLYRDLGGLNERWLPVTFNDTDYCLRLLKAGYRVLFTPHAELYHHESATRGIDTGSFRKELRAYLEMQYMRARWGERMTYDPYYNPNLSYRRPDFSLGETLRVRRPWTA